MQVGRTSIDNKILKINAGIESSDEEKLLEIYNYFHAKNSIINRRELARYYKKNIPKLFEGLQKILKIKNPYELYNGKYTHRAKGSYKFGAREKNCDDEKISKETLLQRHLYRNALLYESLFGTIVGYEITIPNAVRKAPVDLISVEKKDGGIEINLIELKTCTLGPNVGCSKELLLRAIFEVSGYYAWFKAAQSCETDGLCFDLAKICNARMSQNFSEADMRKAKINKVVLASQEMLEELQEYVDNEILKEYKFFSISKCDTTVLAKVGDCQKRFDIERYSI